MGILNRLVVPLKNRIRSTPFLRGLATRFMVSKDFPTVIGVDPTNHCNLNCAFCGTRGMKTAKGFMDFTLFESLIKECKEHPKLWMLILHNFGEPLMNKDIGRMVALAKQENVARSIQFATNGTLLDENMAKLLIEAGLDGLVLSIDAVTREEYQALKGRDLLDRVIENGKRIMELKRRMKSRSPYVSAKMVRRKGLESGFRPFLNLWREIVDEATLTSFSNWGGAVRNEGKVPDFKKRYACHFLWYYPAVNWDGKVFFCCAACDEEAVIGDLRTSSMQSIWKSEKLRLVREAHLRGDFDLIEPCANCTYWAESNLNLDRFLESRGI